MKCLPATKLVLSNGVGIHDWHAEVLAIRTLNRYLLDECHDATDGSISSGVVSRNTVTRSDGSYSPPFSIHEGVKLHMYCSEAPCRFFKMNVHREVLVISVLEDHAADAV